ncbi:uncharacterized protein LOC115440633 isoform X2 [Manduca sexta]|uniref:uncharacterized protein LOC115440633 isoform X2 n=1 Tax=Manduca sexta TaxID=7130 RepID=UPI0018901F87|nr:uncharacterized protein LOC115440633 isoform X2 [Manduca sexta]
MSSLGLWSVFAILLQTLFSITISWLILDCKLSPIPNELHEVTLMKLLYLYDPEACGRLHFYNYTFNIDSKMYTNVIWPVRNEVASSFRSKIRIWLAFHLIWIILGVVNMTQGSRPCGFYATLLPFTLTGLALLIMDVVYAVLFLIDARYANSEAAILRFINTPKHYIHSITRIAPLPIHSDDEDTSWIPVVIAYISVRGIVPWLVNFWIVKDNYYEGLAFYRRLQTQNPKDKLTSRSSHFSRLSV